MITTNEKAPQHGNAERASGLTSQDQYKHLLDDELPQNIPNAAHWFYQFGFKVVPVDPTTKATAVKWGQWLDVLSHNAISEHWAANPTHQLGAIVDSDLFIMDGDTPEAIIAMEGLEEAMGITPNLVVKTKKGEHHYFKKAPDAYAVMQSFSTAHEPEKIDIRTGRTPTEGRSLIILPPSTGKSISLNEASDITDLAEVDQAFIDAVARHNGKEPPRAIAPRVRDTIRTKANASESAELLAFISPEVGYEDWLKVLMGLHDKFKGSEEGLMLADQWSSQAPNYCGFEELEYKWRSFSTGKANSTSFASIAALAATGGADVKAIARKHAQPVYSPLNVLEGKRRIALMLTTPPPPRVWLVDQLMPLGVAGIIAAAGGTGKSMAVLQLAISVATRRDWLGFKIKTTGGVLMLSTEDDYPELHRRLAAVLSTIPEEEAASVREQIAERIVPIDRVGMNNQLTAKVMGELSPTALVEEIIKAAKEVPDCALIVLDPLARFDGGNPNDNAEATRLVECAEAIRKATGATVLMPHHVNKNSMKESEGGQESARGASGLVDGIRWMGLLNTLRPDDAPKYNIEPEDAGNFVRFTIPKNNYAPRWGGMWLSRTEGGTLIPVKLTHGATVKKEQKADNAYSALLTRLIDLISKKDPMTKRQIEDKFGGTTGPLKAGGKAVRGAIERALLEGQLVAIEAEGNDYIHLPHSEQAAA